MSYILSSAKTYSSLAQNFPEPLPRVLSAQVNQELRKLRLIGIRIKLHILWNVRPGIVRLDPPFRAAVGYREHIAVKERASQDRHAEYFRQLTRIPAAWHIFPSNKGTHRACSAYAKVMPAIFWRHTVDEGLQLRRQFLLPILSYCASSPPISRYMTAFCA